MQMYINLCGQRGRASKEIHANAPGIAFQYLQCHRVKLPVVQATQEIDIAYQRVKDCNNELRMCRFKHALDLQVTRVAIALLTISVPKSSISVAGHSPPLVDATRMVALDSILLNIEGPIVTGLEEVDFLGMVLLPLQSCLDVSHRKTKLTHRIWSCYLPFSIKHPVAVTYHSKGGNEMKPHERVYVSNINSCVITNISLDC